MSGRLPRICLLTETYHPVVGGGEKQAQSLAEDLIAHGFETLIVTRRSSRALARTEAIGPVTVVRVPPAGTGGSRRWLMLAPAFMTLIRARRGYDIILVSGFKALGLAAVLAAKLLGKRCVLKADSNGEMSGEFFAAGLRTLRMTPSSWPFRWLLAVRNGILRRADRFVAITEGIAREYADAGVPSGAICRISNSVDTNRFRPVGAEEKAALRRRLKLPAAGFLVTYTGRLVSYKGLPLLLKVAHSIQQGRGNVGFVLIGSGGLDIHNCEAALREYVSANGLDRVVQFAGEVSNVSEYLQASDAFVLPTEDDAFPLSLIEAMACGLPVVSTVVGGIPEIVREGETGILVRPGNQQELDGALRSVIASHDLAASLGRAARLAVEARYSRERVANQYMALLTALHAGRGPCA